MLCLVDNRLVIEVVPARVEGQSVFFQHTLKKSYDVIAVFNNEPILLGISANDLKAKFFIERF